MNDIFKFFPMSEFNGLQLQLKNELFSYNTPMISHTGNIPLIFTAAHSVSQNREGRIKLGECVCGAIVEGLCRDINCYGSYKTVNMNDDANFDESNYFKDNCLNLVKEYNIRLAIDIHCMSDKRDYDVDIGTGEGKNLKINKEAALKIQQIFVKNGISNVKIDHIFKSNNPNTLSSFLSREGNIDAIQLEICWALLDKNNPRYNFDNVIKSLKEITALVEEHYV